MAGPSWLVDGSRIASKIRSACNHEKVKWQSNPTKTCPNCHYIMDNSDVAQQWPGLPRGVKFDPSDQEIILHLLAKVGVDGAKPHPFIDEFIPTVNKEGGICYTHPQNLPGVKLDGNSTHFFHRAIKAYNTGTRKRRKIQDDDFGGVRWHKTGRTKPVVIDGAHVGNKKIMVLYTSMAKGKAAKSNWVMHQYHLGTDEEELDGEYVISKIFIQQAPSAKSEKLDASECDPSTPKSVTPEPSSERRFAPVECVEDVSLSTFCDELIPEEVGVEDCLGLEGADMISNEISAKESDELGETNGEILEDENKWWEGESQVILDTQQIVEGMFICDAILGKQSPERGEAEVKAEGPLSEYAKLGAEQLKKDLEACQGFEFNPTNIELDTPPDFSLSQLEFGSQDSFLAWGNGKL